ncbi:MAG: hypothetical protein ACI837_000691 [Crocinitomicaceae bacterium]|jgi:hypothetical protein
MRFYVNKNVQANGDHEVHQATCLFLPNEVNRINLGEFFNCATAVEAAKEHYPKSSNGCFFCAILCHEK